MLTVKNLSVNYDHIEALIGVDLEVEEGKIVTIIGANGAGKSTTLKVLSGMVSPRTGDIFLRGKKASGRSSSWWVRNGVVHCPEGRQIFPRMSVYENLEMGAFLRRDGGIKKDLSYVFELFPILNTRRKQAAGTLSGGEQQMLAIGRAMMASPDLLMLDEPSLGLAPLLVQKMFGIIEEINSHGKTVLLVEQNAKMALQIADYGYVLETGKIVFRGKSDELLFSDIVQTSYLGKKFDKSKLEGGGSHG